MYTFFSPYFVAPQTYLLFVSLFCYLLFLAAHRQLTPGIKLITLTSGSEYKYSNNYFAVHSTFQKIKYCSFFKFTKHFSTIEYSGVYPDHKNLSLY
jgi:hypothetical protein